MKKLFRYTKISTHIYWAVLIAFVIYCQPYPVSAQKTGQEKIDSLLTVLKTAKNDTVKLNTLNTLADEFKGNNPDTAIYFARQAKAIAIKLTDKMEMAKASVTTGIAMANFGSYPEALENINEALKIYDQLLPLSSGTTKTGQRSTILKQKAMTIMDIGIIYGCQGNYPESLNNFLTSLKISEDVGDKRGIARCRGNIGLGFFYLCNFPEALKNHLDALKINEEIGDKQGIAINYLNIGSCYTALGNHREALKYYFDALKINKEIGDKQGIARNYSSIGDCYTALRKYPEALNNLSASLKIFKEIGNKLGIADSYYSSGLIYYDQKNYPASLQNCLTALTLFEEIGDDFGIINSHVLMGQVYTNLKKYREALQHLNTGLSLAKEIGNLAGIKESYMHLAALDSAQGNFKQSLKNFKMAILARDSMYNQENSKKIVQSKMQYEFDKKESLAKSEQEKKDAIAAKELQRQKLLRNGFIGGFALLLLVAAVIIYFLAQKRKAARILEAKKTELENTLDQLKQTQSQLIRSEKMASLGMLTAGIAHEINNPVNFINSGAISLQKDYEDLQQIIQAMEKTSPDTQKIAEDNGIEDLKRIIPQTIDDIKTGVARTSEIINGLRNFTRTDASELKEANIHEGLESTLLLLNSKIKDRISVVKEFDERIGFIKCYPGPLNQVFMNLINNAIDAIDQKINENPFVSDQNQIRIVTKLEETGLRKHLKIIISDTGIGIPDEIKDKLFDPFFTTKDVGKGIGLGLSICHGIIEKHGGSITFESRVNEGSTFTMTIPVA